MVQCTNSECLFSSTTGWNKFNLVSMHVPEVLPLVTWTTALSSMVMHCVTAQHNYMHALPTVWAHAQEADSRPLSCAQIWVCIIWVACYPGTPPASVLLAMVTSSLQTSYCHLVSPSTPDSTRPVLIPTLMFKLISAASRTLLVEIEKCKQLYMIYFYYKI